jgi:predicted DNA-binding protein (MmcQ/YjbR family)
MKKPNLRPASSRGGRGALARIRKLCLAFPETTERLSHGAPTFFVREKNSFVMFHDNHHDDGRLAIWCAAPDGLQRILIDSDQARFFRPPYVGHRGWIGVRLDLEPDWRQVATLVADAYRIIAPAKLAAVLESRPNRLPRVKSQPDDLFDAMDRS